MKQYEKESFIKSFLIFFISLEVLNIIIFTFYYKEQKMVLLNSVFSSLKEYNYKFENKNITMDIVKITPQENKEKYKLYADEKEIYAFFDLLDSKNNLLKLSYNFDIFQEQLNERFYKIALLCIIVSFILLVYSFLYSLYALKPYKNAIEILERFFKDIVHDLNTPISSIFINTSILKKNYNIEAVERIEYSSKTISNLYKNLEHYISSSEFNKDSLDLLSILKQRVEYFQRLFPEISFVIPKKSFIVDTSEIGIIRILDNIISNACKYNRQNGSIIIEFIENTVIIQDNGLGMREPSKAFDRFYKESDRGMGIGLNIVKKLSSELDIEVSLKSSLNEGTTVSLFFKGKKL